MQASMQVTNDIQQSRQRRQRLKFSSEKVCPVPVAEQSPRVVEFAAYGAIFYMR